VHNSCFQNPLTLMEAIDKIKVNINQSFEWYAVKTKSGNIIEVGGTHKEFAFDFVKLDSGHICSFCNGFVEHVYRIVLELSNSFDQAFCQIETSTHRSEIDTWKSLNDLILYLDNTPKLNYKKLEFEPVYRQEIDHYKLVSSF
jgi:hypothetical protein